MTRYLAAGTLAGLVVLGSVLVFRSDTEAPIVNQPSTTITPPPETGTPSNGWVAYSAGSLPGVRDIWIAKEGEDPQLLIGNGQDGPQDCPSFSPDGTMLAYGEQHYSPQALVVVRIDEAGSLGEEVIQIPVSAADLPVCLKWSPDGSRLAYQGRGELVVVSLDGTETSMPTSDDGFIVFEWSPDSSNIAVVDDDLFLYPADGDSSRVLVAIYDPGYFTEVSWSPAGDRLAVEFIDSNKTSSFWVGRVHLNGIRGADVVDVRPGEDPRWSPDGAWVAYRAVLEGTGETELRLLDPNTGEEKSSPSYAGAYGHVWSPDSRRLAFLDHDRAASFSLAVASIDEGSPRVVLVESTEDLDYYTDYETHVENIAWQPIFP